MKRTQKIFAVSSMDIFWKQLIYWSKQFQEVVFLDSNDHNLKYHSVTKILACDAMTSIQTDDFEQFEEFVSHLKDWCFGFVSYDAQISTEQFPNEKTDVLQFPDIAFFQPKRLIEILDNQQVKFSYLACCDDEIDNDFQNIQLVEITDFSHDKISLQAKVSQQEYIKNFNKAKQYIHRGDSYELNYCIEFFAQNAIIHPEYFFCKLNEKAKSSFASFVKWRDKFALCASPERYVKKIGTKVISQPIKGTAKRGKTEEEDKNNIKYLQTNPKEQSENLMIVDLVRNDLSKIAEKDTVKVEELCGIYSFPTVHQMISTVVCEIPQQATLLDVFQASFPMGSMTGAPKQRTMEIIAELEAHKRGLYSGTIGYISPNGDADFNVVIRSLLYNQSNKYVSLSVGSAVTFVANAHDEYTECLLKAQSIRELLEN